MGRQQHSEAAQPLNEDTEKQQAVLGWGIECRL